MRQMKYVTMANDDGEEKLYLFPNLDTHQDFVNRLGGGTGCRPVRAGFVSLNDGRPICHGESISLRLQSTPKDTRLLRRQFGIEDEYDAH